MTAPTQLICDYATLVDDVGYHLFGLRAADAPSAPQLEDIERCIAKGLQFIYSSYRWSFLRSLVSITTYASYNTGMITVDATGHVVSDPLSAAIVFPTWSVTAGGWLTIPSVGAFAISARTGATTLNLANCAITAIVVPTTYTIGFNTYPMLTGVTGGIVDSLEGPLTYPQQSDRERESLTRIPEVEIRKMMARSNAPGKPRFYAETTTAFDPTTGSTSFVSLYPVPDDSYTLTAIGTLRPSMIDSSNKYPLGIEVLAPCIMESCLAAAEREIEQKDASSPDAVHNRALAPLLAMAIQRDKEASTADSLGVDYGQEGPDYGRRSIRTGEIYWNAGCGINQII